MRFVNKVFLLLLFFSIGCKSSKKPLDISDTSLYKTWSNVYLVEMNNAIANNDFETYAFFMNEYEDSLKEENNRRLKFLCEDEELKRYGDIEHDYYIQTTMKMAEGNSQKAYFYFNRYMDIMKNRFLYNMDWKPIPTYAK